MLIFIYSFEVFRRHLCRGRRWRGERYHRARLSARRAASLGHAASETGLYYLHLSTVGKVVSKSGLLKLGLPLPLPFRKLFWVASAIQLAQIVDVFPLRVVQEPRETGAHTPSPPQREQTVQAAASSQKQREALIFAGFGCEIQLSCPTLY